MVEHIWSVLCSRSVIDRDSNNITLFDILEEVTFGGVPKADLEKAVAEGKPIHVPLPSEVVTLWSRQHEDKPERGRGRLLLELPSGRTLTGSEFEIDLSTHPRSRHRTRSAGLPFVGAGCYVFRVQVQPADKPDEWIDVARLPFVVKAEGDAKSSQAEVEAP